MEFEEGQGGNESAAEIPALLAAVQQPLGEAPPWDESQFHKVLGSIPESRTSTLPAAFNAESQSPLQVPSTDDCPYEGLLSILPAATFNQPQRPSSQVPPMDDSPAEGLLVPLASGNSTLPAAFNEQEGTISNHPVDEVPFNTLISETYDSGPTLQEVPRVDDSAAQGLLVPLASGNSTLPAAFNEQEGTISNHPVDEVPFFTLIGETYDSGPTLQEVPRVNDSAAQGLLVPLQASGNSTLPAAFNEQEGTISNHPVDDMAFNTLIDETEEIHFEHQGVTSNGVDAGMTSLFKAEDERDDCQPKSLVSMDWAQNQESAPPGVKLAGTGNDSGFITRANGPLNSSSNVTYDIMAPATPTANNNLLSQTFYQYTLVSILNRHGDMVYGVYVPPRTPLEALARQYRDKLFENWRGAWFTFADGSSDEMRFLPPDMETEAGGQLTIFAVEADDDGQWKFRMRVNGLLEKREW